MGLDPTDTPRLLRDVGTDDIYALTTGTEIDSLVGALPLWEVFVRLDE